MATKPISTNSDTDNGSNNAGSSEPKPANKRSVARLAAVQALYQMEIAGSGVMETTAEYENMRLGQTVDGDEFRPADHQWFRQIVAGVVESQTKLDPHIQQCLPEKWALNRISALLRAILRAAAYELSQAHKVDAPVVISEYLDVTKAFHDDIEVGMVNATLDRLRSKIQMKP